MKMDLGQFKSAYEAAQAERQTQEAQCESVRSEVQSRIAAAEHNVADRQKALEQIGHKVERQRDQVKRASDKIKELGDMEVECLGKATAESNLAVNARSEAAALRAEQARYAEMATQTDKDGRTTHSAEYAALAAAAGAKAEAKEREAVKHTKEAALQNRLAQAARSGADAAQREMFNAASVLNDLVKEQKDAEDKLENARSELERAKTEGENAIAAAQARLADSVAKETEARNVYNAATNEFHNYYRD